MKIDEVIKELEDYKKKHGNIEVRVAKSDSYWGTLYNKVDNDTLRYEDRTTLSPKEIENTPAVVFCSSYDC